MNARVLAATFVLLLALYDIRAAANPLTSNNAEHFYPGVKNGYEGANTRTQLGGTPHDKSSSLVVNSLMNGHFSIRIKRQWGYGMFGGGYGMGMGWGGGYGMGGGVGNNYGGTDIGQLYDYNLNL
ncbi:unnamed protein product [Anisakis simplex]|uniref:Secreted protein n=1 Tax=Anisakis simplex TaxID=6269 RepID=A0A0M3K9X6_ANISI|nr:unnamed protein product [Anisakis simplex]